MGENGIIGKAKLAKEETIKSQAIEDIRLKILDVQASKNGYGTLKDLVEKLRNSSDEYIVKIGQTASLSNIGDIKEDNYTSDEIYSGKNSIKITNTKYGYEVEVNKDLEIIGEVTSTVPSSDNGTIATSDKILKNYYAYDNKGKIIRGTCELANVSNSTISEAEVGEYVNLGTNLLSKTITLSDGKNILQDWKVFYKDEINKKVILIMSDYLPYSANTSLNTGLANQGSSYIYNWKSAVSRTDLLEKIGTNLSMTNAWNKLVSNKILQKGAIVQGGVDLEIWVAS